jgi:HEAT repeat protein
MDPAALSDLILPALIDALLTASPPSRSVAAFALGAVNAAQLPPAGRDGLVSGLVAALKDEDWTVRRAAALALGDTRDARALSPLLALLRDDDSAVRGCAAYALGWTLPWHEGHALSPRIVDGLIGLLSDPEELIPPVYQHDRVGAAAADSLRQIGDRRGLEAVRAWEGS